MRALVTGATGFVGERLCRAMLARGDRVWGTTIHGAKLQATFPAAVTLLPVDVRRRDMIAAALDAAQPEIIVHLAGITFEPDARRDPVATYETNILGAALLVDEVRKRRVAGAIDPVVLVIGSGTQYGRHEPSEMPLTEEAVLRPLSVYSASKAAQEAVALEAFHASGVRVIATRSFNHSGPGQPVEFLLPALAARVREAVRSGASSIPIGNVSPIRDWLHVDDVIAAYLALLERGIPGQVYNVASGEGVAVGTIAERIIALAGSRLTLAPDPSLQRPVDVPSLVGDYSKLRAATGWSPSRTLDDLLNDLLRAQAH